MYCSTCGKEISDTAEYCPYCGKSAKEKPIEGTITEMEPTKQPAKYAPIISTILVAVSLLFVFIKPLLGIIISAIGIVYGIAAIKKAGGKWLKVTLIVSILSLLINCFAAIFTNPHKDSDKSTGAQASEASLESEAEREKAQGTQQETQQQPAPSDNTDSQPESDLDSFTIMVYIIGSNLESDGGAATSDILEMASAIYGEDVNVVIQTGGAKQWYISDIPADKIGRFELRDGFLTMVEELPQTSMCRQSTLAEFIKWGEATYPSERYGLILWDHGGGVLSGYGVDENYSGEHLLIPSIASAVEDADVHFDFIGFDACLMGCLECAYSLKDSADYLIASEESEAGIGWFYTDWLTYIGQNPDAPMEEIGRKIVDGLVDSNEADQYWGKDAHKTATLSLIDLDKIDNAYLAWKKFLGMNYEKLKEGGFNNLSKARTNARCYGDNPSNGTYSDMIDMLDYVNECALPGTYDIAQDIRSCIVYTNSNISGSNGLSVYLPYYLPGRLDKWSMPMLKDIGFDDDYFTYFSAFCAALASGNSSIEYEGSLTEDISLPEVTIPELIAFENIDGQLAIPFSEDQVDTIVKIEIEAGSVNQNVDDSTLILTHGIGARFINLTEDGKLIADNSQMEILAFFSDYGDEHYSSFSFYSGFYDYGTYEDGTQYKVQYSPAILNGDELIGILVYTHQTSDGTYDYKTLGYVIEDENQYADRALYQFSVGDVVSPRVSGYMCEDDPYTPFSVDVEQTLVIGEDGLKCGYFRGYSTMDTFFKEHDYVYRYIITDIYQNRHYTQWVYY